MAFVRGNMDQVAKKINDDLFVLSTMEVRRFKSLIKARFFGLMQVERCQDLCTIVNKSGLFVPSGDP